MLGLPEEFTPAFIARLEQLRAALDLGCRREPRFEGGELRLYVNGAAVVDKIFLEDSAGRLTEAYWRWLCFKGPAREAERFAAELRRPPVASETPAANQFMERVAVLTDEAAAVASEERDLNEILFRLYGLSAEERNLVENGRGRHRTAVTTG